MPITVDDKPLEAELDSLAAAQAVPTNKKAMTHAILRAVTEAFRSSNDPLVWMSAPQPATTQQKSNGSASIHAPTADPPATQVSDTHSEDEASTKTTAGIEPEKNCNSDQAVA